MLKYQFAPFLPFMMSNINKSNCIILSLSGSDIEQPDELQCPDLAFGAKTDVSISGGLCQQYRRPFEPKQCQVRSRDHWLLQRVVSENNPSAPGAKNIKLFCFS